MDRSTMDRMTMDEITVDIDGLRSGSKPHEKFVAYCITLSLEHFYLRYSTLRKISAELPLQWRCSTAFPPKRLLDSVRDRKRLAESRAKTLEEWLRSVMGHRLCDQDHLRALLAKHDLLSSGAAASSAWPPPALAPGAAEPSWAAATPPAARAVSGPPWTAAAAPHPGPPPGSSSSALRLARATSRQQILEWLDQRFNGQRAVKEECVKLIARVMAKQKRGERLEKLNFWMTGNPGTGKTKMAKILGEILYELGALGTRHVVETNGYEITAEYEGQTEAKVQKKLEKATDGVLFIDEAYTLLNSKYGKEALEVLMVRMSEQPGNPAIVFAGYESDMATLRRYNAGVDRRIGFRFRFADFSHAEIARIAYDQMQANLDKSVELATVQDFIERAYPSLKYNARFNASLAEMFIAHVDETHDLDEMPLDRSQTLPYEARHLEQAVAKARREAIQKLEEDIPDRSDADAVARLTEQLGEMRLVAKVCDPTALYDEGSNAMLVKYKILSTNEDGEVRTTNKKHDDFKALQAKLKAEASHEPLRKAAAVALPVNAGQGKMDAGDMEAILDKAKTRRQPLEDWLRDVLKSAVGASEDDLREIRRFLGVAARAGPSDEPH